MNIRLFLIAATMLAITPLYGKDVTWYSLDREEGCTSLTNIYESFPYLSKSATPSSMYKALHQRFPDAELQAFLDDVAKEHAADGTHPSKEEQHFFRSFTISNAFVLLSKKGGVEVNLVTEGVCKSIGGFANE
jgi:hypothetical protein